MPAAISAALRFRIALFLFLKEGDSENELFLLGKQSFDPRGFIERVGTRRKFGLIRVSADVAGDVHEVIPIADQAVEVVFLP